MQVYDRVEIAGARARQKGVPRAKCPYKDLRTTRGAVTFSRAFRTAWFNGWDKEDKRIREGKE
jgi:ribosome modulation factor